MLRLTANKTKLYTLMAHFVDNLPPMRSAGGIGGHHAIHIQDRKGRNGKETAHRAGWAEVQGITPEYG